MRYLPYVLCIATALPVSAVAGTKPLKRSLRWTPLMISAHPKFFRLPNARAVYGLELSLGKSGAPKVRGLQVAAAWAQAEELKGLQFGTLHAASDKLDGFQISLLPLTLGKVRGGQIGLVNNLKFEEGKERLRVSGIQLASMNSARRIDGMQVGILNTAYRVHGGQLAVVNYCAEARAFQLGAANLIGLDPARDELAKAVQIGLVNFATTEFKGLQIGLFNSCRRLTGVQLGIVNYVHRPRQPRLLLFPFINVGW